SLGNQRPSVLQQSRETEQQPVEEPARQPQPVPVGAQKSESPAQPPRQPRQVQFDDDDLDVPDFLK
ncbi:MAG: hypothetical protein ACRDO4_13895, partial [Nocardioides sp.]